MAEKNASITFTGMIWIGMILVLFGAVIAALGLGGTKSFEGSFGTLKITTTQTGLVIAILGAVLSGYMALHLPKGVSVLAYKKASLAERITKKIPLIAAIIIVLAVVFLILTYMR